MATNEVSDIITMVSSITEANVYGVKVPGEESATYTLYSSTSHLRSWSAQVMFSHGRE